MANKNTRKNLKTATAMLAAITTVVWLILVIVKFYISGMNIGELFDEILSNILGILPPIILFNFAYEYITKDYMADEISEEITQTLMSNPRALQAFDKDVKREFVKSTISSLVGKDKTDAVYGAIEPYLVYSHNIRSLFEYSIEIRNYNSENEKDKPWNDYFEEKLYFRIKEKFSCKKILTGNTAHSNSFKIGFFSKMSQLDNELKSHNYVFRENLSISNDTLEKLSGMTADEKIEYVKSSMSLNAFFNGIKADIVGCEIDENGITIDLKTSSTPELNNEIKMDIVFYMPQLKKDCEFFVSITEPTYEPKINLIYDENTMNVRTYPFLNEDTNLLEKAMRIPGEVTICPKGWVYPVKGVVFIIDEK